MKYIVKNRNVILALVFVSIVFLCCTSTRSGSRATINYAPDSTEVAVAKSHWPTVTLASLNQGYAIFNSKCTDCHEMKKPQDFSVKEWNDILPGMSKKANLDTNQYKLVYRYVLAKQEELTAAKK